MGAGTRVPKVKAVLQGFFKKYAAAPCLFIPSLNIRFFSSSNH